MTKSLKEAIDLVNKVGDKNFLACNENIIEITWALLASKIFKGFDLNDIHYRAMRHTYYSGFVECFCLIEAIASVPYQNSACNTYNRLSQEIRNYYKVTTKNEEEE